LFRYLRELQEEGNRQSSAAKAKADKQAIGNSIDQDLLR
jgi:hypothetical protein